MRYLKFSVDKVAIALAAYRVENADNFNQEYIPLKDGVRLYNGSYNTRFVLIPETHPLWQTVTLVSDWTNRAARVNAFVHALSTDNKKLMHAFTANQRRIITDQIQGTSVQSSHEPGQINQLQEGQTEALL